MNKKQFLCVATSLAAVVVAAPVWAETAGASKLYLSVSVGQSKADLGNTGGLTVDDKDTSHSIGLGYKINDMFSVEVGYQSLGKASIGASGTISGTYYGKPYSATGSLSATAEGNGYYLGPVLNLPMSDKFEAYARAGVYHWNVDNKASATGTLTYDGTTYTGGTASSSDKGNDGYYGLGVAYKINKEVSVGAEWTRFDVDSVDVDVFAAKLKYSF